MACNEFYNDKAGLPNLISTKDDFASINGTIELMNILKENRIELVDVGYE